MNSIWALIKERRFSEACALADLEFARSKDVTCLRNKVLALLNMGETKQALDVSEHIIRMTGGDTDMDYIFLGVAHWLRGETRDAVVAWKNGMDSDYTDAGGGVEILLLRYFAAIRLHDPASEADCRIALSGCQSASSKIWPCPLAGYALGVVTEQDMMSAMSSVPELKARQLCQASFYRGVMRLRDGKVAEVTPFFLAATQCGPSAMLVQEFYLGQYEVNLTRQP